MTSSMLALTDDATAQKPKNVCFRLNFLHLFDVVTNINC